MYTSRKLAAWASMPTPRSGCPSRSWRPCPCSKVCGALLRAEMHPGFVDATDGTLARRSEREGGTPSFDGRRLDDIVDFIIFYFPGASRSRFSSCSRRASSGWRFVPALERVRVLPGSREDRGVVRGFPSYWNIGCSICTPWNTPWVNHRHYHRLQCARVRPIPLRVTEKTECCESDTGLRCTRALSMFVIELQPTEPSSRDFAMITTLYPLYYFAV